MIKNDRETTVPHIILSGCSYLIDEFYLRYVYCDSYSYVYWYLWYGVTNKHDANTYGK